MATRKPSTAIPTRGRTIRKRAIRNSSPMTATAIRPIGSASAISRGRMATSSSAMIVTATSTLPPCSISTLGVSQTAMSSDSQATTIQATVRSSSPPRVGRRRPTVRNWARYSLPSRRSNSIDYTSTRSPGAAITTRVASPSRLASAARRCGGSASRLRRQRIPIGHSVPQWIGTVIARVQ